MFRKLVATVYANCELNILIWIFLLKLFPLSNFTDTSCKTCEIEKNALHRPSEHDFGKYLSFFLRDNPDDGCAKTGHAAYAGAMRTHQDPQTNLTYADTSCFMAYHSILKTSSDYYEALRSARKISGNITHMLQARLMS